jgi:hypothetical protein
MVYTPGQILGMIAFTVVVLAVGGLLLKLDSMIGANPLAEESAEAPETGKPAALGKPARKRRR